MVIANRDGRIVLANAQTKRFRLHLGRIRGTNCRAVRSGEVPQPPSNTALTSTAAARAAHGHGPEELSGVAKNGTTLPVEISLSPLDDGDEFLVTAAIRDVSERKKVETHCAKAKSGFACWSRK